MDCQQFKQPLSDFCSFVPCLDGCIFLPTPGDNVLLFLS